MGRTYGQDCPMARTLEIVGDRWTLLVVRELLLHGERRFADLEHSLQGIAPNVLSERLKDLEDNQIVERAVYSQRPLRASYRLTERGRDLGLVAGALSHFGAKHLMENTRLTHGRTGHTVGLRYYCPECDKRVPGAQVWPEVDGRVPGPARETVAD